MVCLCVHRKSSRMLLQGLLLRNRQHSTLNWLVLGLEVIHHLGHCDPFDTLVLVDMFNEPLMHQKHMRSSRNIGVNGHWEDKLVVLAIEIVEVVLDSVSMIPGTTEGKSYFPQVLHNLTVNPAMTIRNGLHEHHWGQVIQIPVGRDLNHARFLASDQRLHPCFSLSLIIDFRPLIPGPEIIRLAVLMRHRVVIFDAIGEKQLRRFLTNFPPWSDRATRWLAVAKLSEQLVRMVEDISLLFQRHGVRVLV